ncbi:hypothetical protein [Streptomyces sp. NPDC002187]|uniref:hypothetical protein n=1 Tax=Streptomyces sp. NPDC002187 TaxID=3364637 RepID=UPI00368F93D2
MRARLAWRMQPAVRPTALIVDDTGFKNSDSVERSSSACTWRAGRRAWPYGHTTMGGRRAT